MITKTQQIVVTHTINTYKHICVIANRWGLQAARVRRGPQAENDILIDVYVYMYTCVYIHMYVYIYIYTYWYAYIYI